MRYVAGNEAIFLDRLTSIVEANLGDEDFGVSELAEKSGMSRSRLYFRIKTTTQKTASQFIREFRLNKALELLRQPGLTVSEIAYRVGFGSPAYFNKCFHEKYGFPPGETKMPEPKNVPRRVDPAKTILEERARRIGHWWVLPFVVTLLLLTWAGYGMLVNRVKRQGNLAWMAPRHTLGYL